MLVFQSLLKVWWNQNFFNEDLLDPYLALIVPSPALITPLPASIFPNKLAPSVESNILRNPPFCSFASSFIVSLTSFNSIPESSRDLNIFKMSFNSSFEIFKVVVPDQGFFCLLQHLWLMQPL